MRTSLIRGVSWLGGANLIVKPLWFLFITAGCVRVMGISEYGLMTASLALMGIAGSLATLGTSLYSLREVARSRGEATRYLLHLLPLRIVLQFLALVVGLVLVGMIGDGPARISVALGAWAYWALMSLLEYVRTFYRAFDRLEYEAVSVVAEKILTVAVGLTFLLLYRSATATLGGMALGLGVAFLLNLWWLHRNLVPFRRQPLSLRFAGAALWASIPLGLANIFTLLYSRTDSVMLDAMQGNVAAGQYGIAFRIPEALVQIPDILIAGVLPRLSMLYGQQSLVEFDRLLWRSVRVLLAVSLPLAAVIALSASPIVHMLDPAPASRPAAESLRVLIWSFPLACVNYLLSSALIASDRQKALAWMMGAAAVLNPLLNLLLIPAYGSVGAASATIATQFCLLFMMLAHYRSQYRTTLFAPNQF